MKRSKFSSLQMVPLLMALSFAVLVAFCSQWVYSQYGREKERLQSDLATVYEQAGRETMDSLLLRNVLAPLLEERRALGLLPRNDMRVVVSQDLKYSVDRKRDSVIHHEVEERVAGKTKRIRRFVVRDTFSERTIRLQRHPDSGNVWLMKGMQLLVNRTGGDGMEFLKTPAADSLLGLRFAALSDARGWDFDTRFLPQGAERSRGGALVVESALPEFGPRLSVEGYSGYLSRQIAPQISFALLLVALTGGAFLLAWRSLRRQVLLNGMKNDFISNMSHELKTPVATVKVALEAIDRFRVVEDAQRTKEYLEMARLELERLDLLVQQSLNTAMLESGKLAVASELVDAKSVAEGLVRTLQPRLEAASSRLAVHAEGSRFSILADPLHLQGVLVNLLDNALKYGGEGVQIEMKIWEEEEAVRIEVSDNGPGIPAEYRSAVFDSYFRVPTENQHDVKGHGLGLSYSRQAVERMDGSIRVEGYGGRGCRFVIRFPKAQS